MGGVSKKPANVTVRSMIRRLKARSAEARADAAERLGLAGDVSAVEALKASARDGSAEVRLRVIEALGRLAQGSSAEVVAALNDEDELVRVHAAEALSIATPKSIRSLHMALRDSSPLVRSYAAAALGRVGRPSEKAALHKALRRERNQGARLGYYEGLWLLGERRALDWTMQLLRQGEYRARLAAAKALSSTFMSSGTYERIVRALRARETTEKHSVTSSTIARLLAQLSQSSRCDAVNDDDQTSLEQAEQFVARASSTERERKQAPTAEPDAQSRSARKKRGRTTIRSVSRKQSRM